MNIIIGLGNFGCSVVNSMNGKPLPNARLIVCDTDIDRLNQMDVELKIPLASPSPFPDETAKLLAGFERVAIVAGLGGRCGSQAAMGLAMLLKGLDKPPIAFVTTPMSFDGPKRMHLAKNIITCLDVACFSTYILDLDKRLRSAGNVSLSKFTENIYELFYELITETLGKKPEDRPQGRIDL